jgi:hypothetical protein
MKKFIVIILSSLALFDCQEPFHPDIETVEPFVVIEGLFTSLPNNHIVKIHYTRSFNERPYYQYMENALVEIEDEDKNLISFYDYGKGIYRCDTNNAYQAEVGKTYILRVITPEGDIYESQPQTVVESPEINKLYCNYNQKVFLTENTYGDILEISKDGIQIKEETKGVLPIQNYYFFRWTGYEQHVNVLTTPYGISSYYIFRHRKINFKYQSIIRTGNADEYSDFEMKNNKIVFIALDDMVNYIQPFPVDTFTLHDNWFEGLLFKLEQLSVSDDAYSFWRNAELQLEAEGRLFDPVASQLKGNIRCVNDTTKNIVGIFNASHVSVKYAYFYINYKNETFSMDIDGFPTLYLDTCNWSRPDDWIPRP